MSSEPLNEQERRRVMARAVELQQQADERAARARDDAHMTKALGELGVEEARIAQAVTDLADQEARELAAAEARKASRRASYRLAAMSAGWAVVLTSGGLFAWSLVGPAPPFGMPIHGGEPWSADVSPGSVARMEQVGEVGRGQVLALTVEEVVPLADGTWRAAMDGGRLPEDLGRYDELVVGLRGTLPAVRVYLEAGGERWRSAPVTLTEAWTDQTLPLSAFEHQVRQADGKWQVVEWTHPGRVQVLSFKVGHFINPVDARGELRIDDPTWR